MTERTKPLYFWEFNVARAGGKKRTPYISPELQKGTTPLVKLMGGKATRDFNNVVFTDYSEDDCEGPRAITSGPFKLVIHEQKEGQVKRELFNVDADPAEKLNLIEKEPAIAKELQKQLHEWQLSVLKSLTGADYKK